MKQTEEELYDEIKKEKLEEMRQDAKEEARMEFNMYDDEEYCAEMLGIQEAVDDLQDLVKRYESYGHIFNYTDWI